MRSIFHLIEGTILSFFNAQMSLESPVSFLFFSCLIYNIFSSCIIKQKRISNFYFMLVLRGSCLTQSVSQLSYIYIYIYIYVCETLWHLFMDGVQLPQGYTATIRRFLPLSFQKFLVLIRSILEGWKYEMTLNPSSGFKLGYQSSYYQI